MPESFMTVAYLGAAVLFILSLGGLSAQDTARRGNLYGIVGMIIAIGVTLFHPRIDAHALIGVAIAVGAVIGFFVASRVAMTSMPQLVAALHSFVGLAAVLVGYSSHLDPGAAEAAGSSHTLHAIEIWVAIALGAITFTGSVAAWLKLDGRISGRPLLLPARHFLNLAMLIAIVVLAVPFAQGHDAVAVLPYLGAMTFLAALLGVHLVVAIGGADMPVVVSLLNSYSGWTAAAAGFMLGNDLLIITGALVGSSGAILSYIMCRGMNRSIWNVVFGGFGTKEGQIGPSSTAEGEVVPTSPEEVCALISDARRLVVVPGYGMAVAQAQHPIHELGRLLRERGVEVRYAIHPVAGRLPGHMNVLLAEAGIPYDHVLEMDEINEDFAVTDLVLVIGANDIVNPGALTDANSPIYGMPVIQAWHARTVVVLKRGMASGYAGVDNPLFVKENCRMLFGDARQSVELLVTSLRTSSGLRRSA